MANQRESNPGSPDTRPSFYKIMFLSDNINHVKIPPDFMKHLMEMQTDRVALVTGAGKWNVKLAQDEKGETYMFRGWKEFVQFHALGEAEFLVFKYNGDMSFDVVIHDKNGIVRNYESVEIPRKVSSFGSCFPFFKHEIKADNVGSEGFLPIPQEFSRRHLHMSKQMILQNPEKVPWQVNISRNSAFRGGWKAFSDSNSIKQGDVCIFELLDKNVMQVHIFK